MLDGTTIHQYLEVLDDAPFTDVRVHGSGTITAKFIGRPLRKGETFKRGARGPLLLNAESARTLAKVGSVS